MKVTERTVQPRASQNSCNATGTTRIPGLQIGPTRNTQSKDVAQTGDEVGRQTDQNRS